MSIIQNIPQALIDEHMNWHDFPGEPNKGGRKIDPWPSGATEPAPGSGLEFLQFHEQFVAKFHKWVHSLPEAQRPDAAAIRAWANVPKTLKTAVLGWNAQHSAEETRLKAADFASLDHLGRYCEWGIHPWLHDAAAHRWNEPVLNTMESPRSTHFYQIHGLVEHWKKHWQTTHGQA